MIRRALLLFILLFTSQGFTVPKNLPKPNQKVIILDAGHGGLDLGARAKGPYLEEKRICLSTALLTKKYLDKLGYKVILTRSSDVFIPLQNRVKNASPTRASLFVSLHYNSAPNKTAHGIEVYYPYSKKDTGRSNKSKKLANSVLRNLITRTHAKSRGIKQGNFYVIRESKIPAILVEGGFISNTTERKKLRQREYLDKVARAIADGVDRYFKS